jgi:diguanylate cyclase (GGDEF)-like protein
MLVNKKHFSYLQFSPWIILLLGLTMTYFMQNSIRVSAWQTRQDEFNFRANEIRQDIDRRLHSYEQILDGTVGLFAASGLVERREFAEYIRSLKLEGKYPGIQGIGFAKLVLPQDKARHVAQIRTEEFPDYDIRPAGSRDVYTSIIYLEPRDWRNQRAFGFDMYSEPVRRLAMAGARDERKTRISGKVRLLQETEKNAQPGFLMYLPVYRSHVPENKLNEREEDFLGWVYAPFRMNDLMAGILGKHFGEISASLDLEIYDGATAEKSRLMFDSNETSNNLNAAFHTTLAVPLFGHQWTLIVRSLPAFDASVKSDKANIVAVAGGVGSILLAMVVWLLVTARTRALAMAKNMTAELRQSEKGLRKLNRALHLLSRCNTTLVHAEEEYKLLAEICRLSVEHGGYLMAWVGYAEQDEEKSIRPVAQFGNESGYLDGINITWADSELGQGPTGTAIRTGVTNINQNVLTNPKMAPWREAAIKRGYQSSVALPLVSDAVVLGALTMYAREADAFNADEVALLEELASDLAFGIMTLRTRVEHAAAKEKIAFLAYFDPLTHLPNRLLLRDRFEQAIRIAETKNDSVAILYLDLDNFKQINEALGHEVGDKMLRMAVERLWQWIPATDTISRLNGDEFVILLTGARDSASIATVANTIREAFSEPIVIDGSPLNTSFSIGISLFPNDGRDFDTLLKQADTAVSSAKEGGGNTFRFFTREMNIDALEQLRLAGQMLNALRNREFIIYYQPQVAIASSQIVGAEALVRWQHPVNGLILPEKFIHLAEQSGHIVQIGEWVLNEACRQARGWLDHDLPSFVIAVNLSALQFKYGNVLEMVSAALTSSGLPPHHLELELTESILLQDLEVTLKTIHSLKALGVKLSIDDFGTGYSSLSYLKQLAVDKLKIDQSFVRDMLTNADGAAIVKAIIQLGHTLQLTVIAEGVETDEQLAFLGGCGCDEVQGYLFSRPVPAEQFASFVESRLSRRS